MQTISDVIGNSVKYTADYLKAFFTGTINGNLAKVDAVLADMINGAKTASCTM